MLIINNGFLGRYYLSHKAKDLVRTYYAVDDVLQEGSLTDLSVLNGIISRTERGNIDIVVTDSGGKAVFSTLGEQRSETEPDDQRCCGSGYRCGCCS